MTILGEEKVVYKLVSDNQFIDLTESEAKAYELVTASMWGNEQWLIHI